MDRLQAIEQIKIAVERVTEAEVSIVDDTTTLLDELGVDSTGIMEILVELEDRCGLEIDVDTLEPAVFESVGTLADYVVAMAPAD